jgi:hypothetical protein
VQLAQAYEVLKKLLQPCCAPDQDLCDGGVRQTFSKAHAGTACPKHTSKFEAAKVIKYAALPNSFYARFVKPDGYCC